MLFVHSLDLHPSIEVEYLNLLLLFAPSIGIQLDYGFDPMMLITPDVGGRVVRCIKCQNLIFGRVSYDEQLRAAEFVRG